MKMYKIIDTQGTGWRSGLYFNDKDEIRQNLIDLHSSDCEDDVFEGLQKMTLDEVLDYGEWSIEEVEMVEKSTNKHVITCPLCEDKLHYKQVNDSHIWTCTECPFISFEYYGKQNLEDLTRYLNLTK